ncbi:MAG: NAD-binding protein, partial [Dehalococcoidia bacterium]|nr:NAD-binding protein [Dehalococcoidia bacterium]
YRNHAILCGYGRVGRVVGQTLRRRGLTFVVIDQDQQLVRRLRESGVPAWVGNPDIPRVLDAAGIATARVLVLAIPNARVNRLAVEYARQVNARLSIVVRAHSLDERDYLLRRGVQEVVVGELELAFELTRYTLQRFGVSAQETRVIVQRLRADAEGGDE